ncbi:hypothetical protein PPE_06500 [Paenibacillus polymyxa E681]|nr:hypothetical protein PPE_06500 [Paenibacillus polymyxa E681]
MTMGKQLLLKLSKKALATIQRKEQTKPKMLYLPIQSPFRMRTSQYHIGRTKLTGIRILKNLSISGVTVRDTIASIEDILVGMEPTEDGTYLILTMKIQKFDL